MFAPRLPCAMALMLLAGTCLADTPESEVRAAFDKYIAAQNSHDLKALESLLLDSPQFLWISRGTPIWGREAALKRFESNFQTAGTWKLEPETAALRFVLLQDNVAQLFVPVVFTHGRQSKAPAQTRSLMNQVLVKTGGAWKVASILSIPALPPGE